MQALIFGLTFPVLPLLAWRRFGQKEQVAGKELLIRYAVYALVETFLASVAMFFLCDEGSSFQAKMDASPAFVLKFVLMELMAAVIIIGAEWIYTSRKLSVKVAWQEYRDMGIGKFVLKFLIPAGIYLIALMVVLLNISLMFDNVLWGDECFSGNTAQKTFAGIMQVNYFWDSHPPLYYFWLKIFGDVLGHTGPMYHLASLIPFFVGIVLALTSLRKRLGNIPAAFFIIVTGLASPCLHYNVEIRMYSLAFMGLALCYYCAYRVLGGGKLAWFGMVIWGLVAAYSHYYAMMSAGLIVFITGVATAIRYKGKTWIKALLALVGFIGGYSPWFPQLFRSTESVSNDWWMTETLSLRDSMQMVLCGIEYEKIVFILLVMFVAVLLVVDSSFFCISKKVNVTEIVIHRPTLQRWSTETYAVAVGALTMLGTVVAAYLLCFLMGPVLAQRYLYPLCAVTILMLVFGSRGVMDLVQELGKKLKKDWLVKVVKTVLFLTLAVLLVVGLKNFKAFHTTVKTEKIATEQAVNIVGEVPEDTVLITNNVRHLGWTVLYYYYPDREIVTGRCSNEGMEYDKFWYYTPEAIGKNELKEMTAAGYTVENYGPQQIAVYPFELYYFERVK